MFGSWEAMMPHIIIALVMLVVGLGVIVLRLGGRVDTLEHRLAELAARFEGLRVPEPPRRETAVAAPAPEPVAPEPVAQDPVFAPPTMPRALPPPLPAPAPERLPDLPARPGFGHIVFAWLQENWFYAIAALSLALAGIFTAQYAAERGMLSPSARVLLAAALGAVLIGAGEVIRRRWGDGAESATAYLPSIFSGAGLVTLYGAVLSAHMFYGLIAPGPALVLLAAVAALAIALGWFHGPLLVVVGLTGAVAAPFLTGGEPGAEGLIESYFGLVMLVGLMVNALKKWRFVDELALFLPFVAVLFVAWASGIWVAALVASTLMPVIGTVFVGGALMPRIPGPALLARIGAPRVAPRGALGGGPVPWRGWLVRLVWIAALCGIFLVIGNAQLQLAAAALAFGALALLAIFWSLSSAAAADLAALATLSLFVLAPRIAPHMLDRGPEHPAQLQAGLFYLLIVLGAGISLAAAWRGAPERGRTALGWGIGAALAGPGILVIEEMVNAPGAVIGAPRWALIAIGFAALATLLAERAWRRDAPDRDRVSLAALAAMSLIALALFIILSKAALSVALAVLVLGAITMDLRWRLPYLGVFAQAGVAVLVWRALVDPGIGWAVFAASGLDLVLAYAGPAVALGLAVGGLRGGGLRGRGDPLTRAAVEGGMATLLATGVSVLLAREFESRVHLLAGLMGTSWLISGWTLWRSALKVPAAAGETGLARLARRLRKTLGTVKLVLALLLLLAALVLNPLQKYVGSVAGPPVFSSLMPGYLLPGLAVLVMAARMRQWAGAVRVVWAGLGTLLVASYLGLSVAQAWRGNHLTNVAMGEGELWNYTALLLTVGAALLVAALWRRSDRLRYFADAVLVAAILKVFLVDAGDLGGLVRAGSFLILGLALAGLAWINRRAAMASRRTEAAAPG